MIGKTISRYALIASVLTLTAGAAQAQSVVKQIGGAIQSVTPQATVRKDLSVEVTQPGVAKATVSPNPLSGPPRVEGQTGNKDIDNAFKNVDGAIHLPQDAASAAGDAIMNEAKKAVDKFIEDLKAKAWAKYEELKAKYLPYVYFAAAALVLALMLPGFIGALFAIWVVRILDRRTARKRQLELKAALDVVKTQAKEIDTKLAA